jgi:hypothetical protein
MGPLLRRRRGRSFYVGATFVAPQFQHEYIRAVTASGPLWALCNLCQCVKSKSKLCYGRRSVGQSVLVPSLHLGPKTRFLLLSDSCGFVDVGRLLCREDGSVVYNCCWSSPAQSFSVPSSMELMTIFYGLRFETPPTWRARSLYLYPPGTG